jgi:hypothetical protein
LVFALAIAFPAAAGAAALPVEFSGLWVATEAPVARVMSVDGANVNFYETRCTLQTVKRLPNVNPGDKNQVNAEADLACSGEGSHWNAKEIWHVETIDGKKVVVVTGLRQTDYRDEKGRKQNTPSLVTTTVYFACK